MMPINQCLNCSLLSVGFRPFFLLACLFASLAMGLWAAFWAGYLIIPISPVGGIIFWHSHEFLMGFALAAVFGFLLTAVQNWTGLNTTTAASLSLMVLSWLLARAVMLMGQELPIIAITGIVVFPILLCALMIALPIVRKRAWRNLFAPLALLLIACIDAVLLLQSNTPSALASALFMVLVLLISLLISMIGGRVIPMFIANKLDTSKALEPQWVFKLSIIPLPLLITLQFLYNWPIAASASAILLLLLFIGHSLRLIYWFNKGIIAQPMLWSLYLFYACLPLGFLCLAVRYYFPDSAIANGSTALHIITIGAIAGLIASMISRVSLGHTGRVINHDHWIVSAFTLLTASLVIRTLLIAIFGFSAQLISYSAILFSLAFTLLFIRFFWVWLSPRPDQKPE